MVGKFKHEEVATVPRGYRVRTVRRGRHEIRVAFPPGRRRTGAGRVVSILHPVGENPSCPIRQIADKLANPGECKCGSGEPATFGGMCPRCAREKARLARERAGKIRAAALNGKGKQKESRNPDSHRISWSDEMVRRLVAAYQGWRRAGMGHREALDRTIKDSTAGKGAIAEFKRRISRPGFGNNPKRRRGRKNPDDLGQAEDLYREFHGREPREILEVQESDLTRREYTALGDVVELRFILPDGRKLQIDFSEADKVKLASSPDGRQLYFLGGDQDISGALAGYDVDTSRDFVDLGDAVFVSYDASKWQTGFKPTIWEHKLGEESGIYPRGFFDNRPAAVSSQVVRKGRIFFAGGNYRVERPGIID